MDDFDLFIDDYEMKPTKKHIRKIINEEIKINKAATRTPKGLEIDLKPGWEEVLNNDASILFDYEKVGWKVMWMNKHSQGPGRGKLLRSWISIRDRRFVPKQR
tara:strand:+ start:199 stop:507 length:309 start_codon:yes stop_codon:yes gene_type:complete